MKNYFPLTKNQKKSSLSNKSRILIFIEFVKTEKKDFLDFPARCVKKQIPEMKKDCAEKISNKKSKRFEIYDKKFRVIFLRKYINIFKKNFKICKTFFENSDFILNNKKSLFSLRICFT